MHRYTHKNYIKEHPAKRVEEYLEIALMPVFVASLVAWSNGSNMGLNATVNAQSTMYPATNIMLVLQVEIRIA
jgi:hypothetical protein